MCIRDRSPGVWDSNPLKNTSLNQAFITVLEPFNVLLKDRAYYAFIGLLLVVSYLLEPVGCKLSLSIFSSSNH